MGVSKVAAALGPSEIPNASDVPSIVGALVKVLENTGVKVAEELLPKPVEEALAPAAEALAPAATAEATTVLADLATRVESALSKLEGHQAP